MLAGDVLPQDRPYLMPGLQLPESAIPWQRGRRQIPQQTGRSVLRSSDHQKMLNERSEIDWALDYLQAGKETIPLLVTGFKNFI